MDLERSGRIRRSRIRVEIRSESDRPNYETQRYVICESLVQHMFYVLRPELTHVLGMVIDLLWAGQMLLRNWVVIKVGFDLSRTMLRDMVEQDGICPSDQERYTLGPLCDPTRISMAVGVKTGGSRVGGPELCV